MEPQERGRKNHSEWGGLQGSLREEHTGMAAKLAGEEGAKPSARLTRSKGSLLDAFVHLRVSPSVAKDNGQHMWLWSL